ncbi:heart- and neural crest derivatives-expressed protein 2-like [Xenia sp. Carnegie-2017]|uniref:heart- and neural crest derivatives-expressed protein 2-like n=1 Tax=Xenia sp. Carnegie-2017 TaxID=2897299 RepID=UPI001F047C6E|nr:heart- and neural crest derivatives-expressed protein 2-like [Xenia sp. Carnegie-2017]
METSPSNNTLEQYTLSPNNINNDAKLEETHGKERRRTHCINTAFGELRKCIPNVPTDTKLSKIKTLRLAISYIQYLTEMLDADLENNRYGARVIAYEIASKSDENSSRGKTVKNEKEKRKERKCKNNRTGWPQHVWALDLS